MVSIDDLMFFILLFTCYILGLIFGYFFGATENNEARIKRHTQGPR